MDHPILRPVLSDRGLCGSGRGAKRILVCPADGDVLTAVLLAGVEPEAWVTLILGTGPPEARDVPAPPRLEGDRRDKKLVPLALVPSAGDSAGSEMDGRRGESPFSRIPPRGASRPGEVCGEMLDTAGGVLARADIAISYLRGCVALVLVERGKEEVASAVQAGLGTGGCE